VRARERVRVCAHRDDFSDPRRQSRDFIWRIKHRGAHQREIGVQLIAEMENVSLKVFLGVQINFMLSSMEMVRGANFEF